MKKGLFFILAIIFFILGLIGLALPVIPQVPFLVLGVLFLTASSEYFKRWLFRNRIYKKYLKKHVENSDMIKRMMRFAGISEKDMNGDEE